MKKVLKTVLIVILIILVLIIGGCAALIGIMNHVNENYYKYAKPQGKIEKKYTPLGSHEVSYVGFNVDDDTYKMVEVWYPSDIKDESKVYPMVLMVNGTGVKASQYKSIFEHLASWGFIVVGNEDENTRTGDSSAAALNYMLELNSDKSSDFYGKIDTDNIGIAGHSQGGVGAINAVTNQQNGNMYKAIVAASTTSRAFADTFSLAGSTGWNCDVSKLNIPCFMIAGTGNADAGNVDEYRLELADGETQGICPLWFLNECYDILPDSVDKVVARLTGKDHGDTLRSADAYMTAWFMYYLQGDEEAGKAFRGTAAEILNNSNYQDVRDNIN